MVHNAVLIAQGFSVQYVWNSFNGEALRFTVLCSPVRSRKNHAQNLGVLQDREIDRILEERMKIESMRKMICSQ